MGRSLQYLRISLHAKLHCRNICATNPRNRRLLQVSGLEILQGGEVLYCISLFLLDKSHIGSKSTNMERIGLTVKIREIMVTVSLHHNNFFGISETKIVSVVSLRK